MKSTEFIWFDGQPVHRTIAEDVEATSEPWVCKWKYNGNTRILNVPADYTWDGASIPRFAWSLIGLTPMGLMDGPSLAHDPLYRSKGGRLDMQGCRLTSEAGIGVVVDRDEADWVLRATMNFVNVPRMRANIAYGIVRAFGGGYWGGPAPKR